MAVRSKTSDKVYKFVHKEDEYLKTTITGEEFKSHDGFLEIKRNGEIHINASCIDGYAWDGCTPKWELWDFVIGTPDGRFDYITQKPITYFASMVHDALYQYKSEIPISRRVADRLFLKILKESGFRWANLYFVVVCIAGRFFGKWKVKTKIKDFRIVESSWILKAYEEAIEIGLEGMNKYDIIQTAVRYISESTDHTEPDDFE